MRNDEIILVYFNCTIINNEPLTNSWGKNLINIYKCIKNN